MARHPLRLAVACLVIALAVATAPAAASSAERVAISVRSGAIVPPAAPGFARALAGRLDRSQLALLSRHPSTGAGVARAQEVERQHALASLTSAAQRAATRLRPVALQVRGLGGRVLGADALTGVVTATVPAAAIQVLRADPRVVAIEPARVPRPFDLEGDTAAVGAPNWWAVGHTGGRGSSDVNPADYTVIGDNIIQADHPAFAGIGFQRPPGAPAADPCQGGNCVHGTAVASVAISRGAAYGPGWQPSDVNDKGIAPGLDTVLDPGWVGSTDNWNESLWYLGIEQVSPTSGNRLAGAGDAAEIGAGAYGNFTDGEDDNYALRGADLEVNRYGLFTADAAGNSGPGASTVEVPCIAYNTVCVGAYHVGNSYADLLDDFVPVYSSRGPSPGGRKKPDLVAVGEAYPADQQWQSLNRLWLPGESGTSYASPQVAGGAALLMGAGISDPSAVKAILINSARQRLGQTGWLPDWGWGQLDLQAALAQRTAFTVGQLEPGDARFYRSAPEAASERATLVWQRRADGCLQAGCDRSAQTLTNLDLLELDAATGATRSSSASPIDNVEQVRSPGAGQVVYAVALRSAIHGTAAEPFALAARRPLTHLTSPRPTIAIAAPAQLGPGPATITATISNPSSDMSATGTTAALELPAGAQLADGSPPVQQSVGTLAPAGQPGATATVSWTARATGDGRVPLRVTTSAVAYGQTLSRSAEQEQLTDVTPPTLTLNVPAGPRGDQRIPVSWQASDGGASVRDYTVEVSIDGAPYGPWQTAATATSTSYDGRPGHSYRFRARAADHAGNSSAPVESGTVTITGPSPTPTPTPRARPALKISRVRVRGNRVTVTGTISRDATGRVTVVLERRPGGRSFRRKTRSFIPRRGRFTITLRATSRRPLRARVRVSYRGDRRYRPRSASATIARRVPRSGRT